MSITLTIILVILLFYFVVVLFLSMRQSSLVYFPSKKILKTPADVFLKYRDISFQTANGLQLQGWMVGEESARNVLMFFHGNGGNISYNLNHLVILDRLGMKIFIFDYRGYGKSGGSPSEEGTYFDAEAAWKYLTKTETIPPERIIFFGHSIGGAIAANLASKVKPRALILESTFTSIPELGKSLYPFFPVKSFCRFKYDTKSLLPQIKVPVLVIHSSYDELVPYRQGRELFQVANEPKQFLKIYGTHNDGFMNYTEGYIVGLRSFLMEHDLF